MKILENVLISNLTTMRLGGNAKYVAEIENFENIKEAYDFAKEKNLKTFVLGEGANSIGLDEGFNGVILLNKIRGVEIISETETEVFIRAMGGEKWDDFVEFTTRNDFSGAELLSGIPGTVGAAPVQNIGAYGQEAKNIIENAEVFDTELNKIITIPKEEMDFSYRKSIFNIPENKGRYFIAAVTFKLNKNSQLKQPFYNSLQNFINDNNETDFSPKNIRKMVLAIRNAKLPDPKEIASAGSFFKNVYLNDEAADKAEKAGIKIYRKPGENKINTGWLVEEAGLKNKEFYGFRVSNKAALVLINESAKSYEDLVKAREEIKKAIKEKFGFNIEQEPVEIK